MSELTDFRDRFVSMHGAIAQLIILNVALYLAMVVLYVIGLLAGTQAFQGFFSTWLFLPADPLTFLTRPWTLLSYQFLHSPSPFHILFNMLWLYWLGRIYRHEAGDRGVWSTYLLGGLAGGLFYMLIINLAPGLAGMRSAILVGASASVNAIIVAAAVRLPNLTLNLLFLGPVKLKWLVLGVLVLDFVGLLGGNPGGMLAHLGGAGVGFLLARMELQGRPVRLPQFNWPSFSFGKKQKASKLRVVHDSRNAGSGSRRAPQTDAEAELNRILEKINKVGYAKLTQQEKEFLFKASQD